MSLTIEITDENIRDMSDSELLQLCKKRIISYKKENTRFCPICRKEFMLMHGNQKYCPNCILTIRNNKRHKNKERYLHKVITDYINNRRNYTSEQFREESNYYWDIVCGKTPKTERKENYLDYIQTKDDYMEWLERKYVEIKSNTDFQ